MNIHLYFRVNESGWHWFFSRARYLGAWWVFQSPWGCWWGLCRRAKHTLLCLLYRWRDVPLEAVTQLYSTLQWTTLSTRQAESLMETTPATKITGIKRSLPATWWANFYENYASLEIIVLLTLHYSLPGIARTLSACIIKDHKQDFKFHQLGLFNVVKRHESLNG